jgi:hypothetical protein
MKQCPRCNQTYSDDTLNFCLNDGELLTMRSPDPGGYMDPPTMVMDQARVTDPVHGWGQQPQGAQPPAQWQHPSQQPQMLQFGAYPMTVAPNQTLAVVSLCLGAASLTIGWCCSSGLLLGPAAIITGLIARSNIKKDPDKFAGRGMATAGIITGSIFIGLYILIILIYGLAAIGGALGGR